MLHNRIIFWLHGIVMLATFVSANWLFFHHRQVSAFFLVVMIIFLELALLVAKSIHYGQLLDRLELATRPKKDAERAS